MARKKILTIGLSIPWRYSIVDAHTSRSLQSGSALSEHSHASQSARQGRQLVLSKPIPRSSNLAEAATLARAASVDLDPIRAAKAERLAASDYTSVQGRIESIIRRQACQRRLALWMTPGLNFSTSLSRWRRTH